MPINLPLFSFMPEQAGGAAASPASIMEPVQNAPCEAVGSKDEPRAVPEASGSENPILEVQSKWEASDAMDCPQYPAGCLAGCPEYRGMVRWWCRKLHWWQAWATPTGELPAVKNCLGHTLHAYRDGTTRFVGLTAAPTVPASEIPPVPVKASTMPTTKVSRWHEAAKGAVC